MLDSSTYKIMLQKYSDVASWAVWRSAGTTVKSNTDCMDWRNDSNLLDILNTGFVFVGLNCSGTHGSWDGVPNPWGNFHSGYSRQNDYKLRYAFTGTRYWGSYITDLVKHYPEVDSSKVKSYLKSHPEIVAQNVRFFEEEIGYLGGKPVLVALGGEVYYHLQKHLGHEYQIVCVKHYSFTIGKEDYREEVLQTLQHF